MGKRKPSSKGKSKRKPNLKAKHGLVSAAKQVSRWGLRSQGKTVVVFAAIRRLLPFVMLGVVVLYTLLDPIPFCWAAKTVGDAAQAMVPYATLPQAAPCALLAIAIVAAFAESVRDMKLAGNQDAVRQAVTILVKMVLYIGAPFLFAYVFFGPVNSALFWNFIHHFPEVLGLHTEIAKSLLTCWAFIGAMVVWGDTFESVEEPHLITKLVKALVVNVMQALMLVLKLGLYTIVPLTFSVTLAYFFYVLGSQTGVGGAVGAWVAGVGVGSLLAAILPFVAMSALLIEGYCLLKAKPASAPTSNVADIVTDTDITKTSKPVPVSNDTSSASPHDKHAAKHADDTASNDAPADNIKAAYGTHTQVLTNEAQPDISQGQIVSDNDQAVGTHAHSKSKKKKAKKDKTSAGAQQEQAGTSISHTTAPSDDRKTAPVTNAKGSHLAPASHPPSASKATVDGDHAYSTLVKALLNLAVGAPPAVHAEIMKSMTRLYRAVPKWMLKFGTAHNPGCSACDGLEAFKVGFQKHHLKDPSTSAFRSMVLLLRTFVAAIVEEELRHVSSRDHLMAEDILRLTPQAGMADYLREVPQWQLTALQQRLCL